MLKLEILLLVTIVVFAYTTSSTVSGTTNNVYCYDQVGEGHLCYKTEKKCNNEMKKDDIAESPCYNEKD